MTTFWKFANFKTTDLKDRAFNWLLNFLFLNDCTRSIVDFALTGWVDMIHEYGRQMESGKLEVQPRAKLFRLDVEIKAVEGK